MKKLMILLSSVVVIVLGGYLWDLKSDRSKTVKILKLTPLYEGWESLSGEQPVDSVEAGEKLKVRRIRYAKDHMAIKVEKADDSSGWLILDESVEIRQQ